MKKTIYIISFTLLGLLVQFLAHAVVEIIIIRLLLKDFAAFGLGLSWASWLLIHQLGTVAFFLAGAYLGYRQGKYWWRKIYVEHSACCPRPEKNNDI